MSTNLMAISKTTTSSAQLRRAWVTVVLAATSALLFEGWHSLTPAQKYVSFLGFSAALLTIGLVCERAWKEKTLSRTLLFTAAATLPIHFAQLGAMLLSLGDTPGSWLPGRFVLTADSPTQVAILLVMGILVTVPMAYAGFAALNRRIAIRLTVVAMLANGALLFPSRDPSVIATFLLALTTIFYYFEQIALETDTQMKKSEGIAVRMLLLAPVALLITRAMFYPSNEFLESALVLVAASLVFYQLPRLLTKKKLEKRI